MLTVWCFMVFAAVGERLAVSGAGQEPGAGCRSGVGLFSWGGQMQGRDWKYLSKACCSRLELEEEMAHDHLDTR
ncbi:disintegrin and metalloproteinase domain-containing protein 11-like isoform X1 [Lates japonicus]|uniref:Disintegrin and metalloproteinase domain-containing protein 11-like isoform X1 n=1 Tax=Lates japonicus TaxID=270547 RepID=A0AAD3M7U2_LATJO|nr:disintegrin and metalloproteinase domain-containing protein 11-like isoform X1 [Lates japonicus]